MKPLKLPVKHHFTYLGNGKNIDDPLKVGDIGIPDNYRSGHIYCSGSTRSGKSRLAENIIEQDIRKHYNLLVIDPKVDQGLSNKIVQIATATERTHDLMFITTMFPELSLTVNPLSHWFTEEEIVAHCIAGIQEGKEPFFRNVAKDITQSVIEGMNLIARLKGWTRANFTFNEISKKISRNGLEHLRVNLGKALTDPLTDPKLVGDIENLLSKIEQTLSNGEDFYSKISSSLQVALHELTSGNVGKIIAANQENRFIERIEQGKGVILVCQLANMVIDEAAQTLAKVLLSMVMKYIGRIMSSEKEKLDVPLCLHLDEAQSVMFAAFDDAYAKVGSSNTWITSYIQDSAQMRAKLGEDRAKAILSNNNTKIFLRSPDNEGAVNVSDHFGTKKEMSPIITYNGITTREMEKPLIDPFEVISLKPRDFIMLTYASDSTLKGRYRATTHDINPLTTKIIYPSAPGV